MFWWTLRQLKSEEKASALRAAKTLGRSKNPRAVQALLAALRHEHKVVREAAVEALINIGDERAVDALLFALRRTVKESRPKVSKRLAKTRIFFPSSPQAKALVRIGDTAVEPLLAVLKDWNEDQDVRAAAAEILGNMRDTRAAFSLRSALWDKNEFVRVTASWALGEMGDVQAVEVLGDKLTLLRKDSDDDVRVTSAWALGKIGDVRALEPLRQAGRDANPAVRMAAVWALGEIGGVQAVGALKDALKDLSSHVQNAAVESLVKVGDSRAAGALVSVLDFESWRSNRRLWEAARLALVKMGEMAQEPLIAAVKGFDTFKQETSAQVLGEIGDVRAVEALVSALGRDWRVHISAAKALKVIDPMWIKSDVARNAVPAFISALQDRQWKVRVAAAWALKEIGDLRAVEPLITLLSDDNDTVRSAAAEALNSMGWQQSDDTQGAH